MYKKSQTTIYIILSVVIVAVFGFVFLSVSIQTKEKFDIEAEEITKELMKTTAFENYVNKCVEKLTKDALIYVGQQGGKIDKRQGGVDDWLTDTFMPGNNAIPINRGNKTFYVFYGLKKQFLYEDPTKRQVPAPPDYPYPGTILDSIDIKEGAYGRRTSIYGINKLIPLCDINGPNRREAVIKDTCKSYGPGSYSIQRQILNYIQKNLPLCVDFDSFAKTFAYNVSQGNVTTNVTITDTFVAVDIQYPLEIKLKGGKKSVKLLFFKEEVKIRLKKIHEFAMAFINEEAKHLLWNYTNYKDTRDKTDLLWDDEIKFYVTHDACTECDTEFGGMNDNIISVMDTASVIGGDPYEFRFAQENRNPVLDHVVEANFDQENYDIVLLVGSTVLIAPTAFDADEDELIFNYTGWKAEYDEEYEYEGPELINTIIYHYTDPFLENKWHNSKEYMYTSANATYNTSGLDIGQHNITLYVLDDEGIYDFQKIRILVNDNPITVAKGDNYYPNIDNKYASIEDPYEVDATGSTAIFTGPGGLSYIFVDNIENLRSKRSDPIFRYPTVPIIMTMTRFGFTREGLHNFKVHTIDNILYATGTSVAYIPVDVYPCLPHRNPQNPFPYPYHNYKPSGELYDEDDPNYLEDPFQANHACCLGDPMGDPSTWRIADNSIECGPGGEICGGTRGNICGV